MNEKLENCINEAFKNWDKNSHGALFDEFGNQVSLELVKTQCRFFYNLAMKDVKKEVKKKLSAIESKDIAGDSFANGVFDAYYEMLEFIDSLEDEPKYGESLKEGNKSFVIRDSGSGAMGTKMPKFVLDVKPNEDLEKASEHYSENVLAGGEDMFDAIADGFVAGAKWQKKQMMKEAVEVEISNEGFLPMGDILVKRGIHAGDKVRLIIVKQEE